MVLAFPAAEALAMYTPNPAARWDANHFFLAGDFQFNGDKDLDGGGKIDDQVGLFVRPSYAFGRNAVVYGRLGFQDADGLDTGFSVGTGIQAAWELPQARDWTIGGSFDYLFWDTEGAGGGNVDYQEIQFAPAVSYSIPKLRKLTPYAGLALDFLIGDLDEDDPVGMFFGSNFDISDHLRLDGQVRLVNEYGFSLSLGYLY